MTIDNSNNIFVAEGGANLIRKIDTSGNVTTFAGGLQGHLDDVGTSARFDFPMGLTSDLSGNIYVAEYGNNTIRKITTTGTVTTLAGTSGVGQSLVNATGTAARFDRPSSICIDSSGNIFVTETAGRVRKINTSNEVTTYAGNTLGFADGNGTSAQFNDPYGITIDNNNNLYLTRLIHFL